MNTVDIKTPVSEDVILNLEVGDIISISGEIFCGRDAVLPKVVDLIVSGRSDEIGADLKGGVVFHTAVSVAGVGPTSSNKLEIEESIEPLSENGVRIHLGKGRIKEETIFALEKYKSVYAVIPPVSALLSDRVRKKELIAFEELGMEAFYRLTVEGFPAVVAAAGGKSIYEN